MFLATSGDSDNGYASLDNFHYEISEVECPTIPDIAAPYNCNADQFECSDHTCIPMVRYFLKNLQGGRKLR